MWVNGQIPFDRLSDKLMNDKVQKYSAYHQFGTNPLFQSTLILKAIRLLFGDSKAPKTVSDQHGEFNGVTTHENAQFLYQSNQANWVLKWGYSDFTSVGLFGCWLLIPHASYTILPALISLLFIPRRWTQQRYFTWHAELLPHTEQVVLHKTFLFGQVDKHIVDIKNLEKVPAEAIPNALMWTGNMFDQNLVFRDSESEELFVFDKNGIWNENALKHPLLF